MQDNNITLARPFLPIMLFAGQTSVPNFAQMSMIVHNDYINQSNNSGYWSYIIPQMTQT